MDFYNREKELAALNKFKKINNSHFLVITGRRRVGKTELIRQFEKKSNNLVYFFVDKRKANYLLKEFIEELNSKFPNVIIGDLDWAQFIKLLFNLAKDKQLIVVFDEFQNFKSVDDSIFSLFQKNWDLYEKNSKIYLIALGSYIGMMKNLFDRHEASLYGRKTGDLFIRQLDFKTIIRILSDLGVKDFKTIVELYALFGGIPKYYVYLEKYAQKLDALNIIKELILSEPKILKGEINEILYEQIAKEAEVYLSIFFAIANKKHTLNEISQFINFKINSLPKYLSELEKVYELIKREVPITENFHKSKKGRYFLGDNFLKFWFRFIYRHKSYYELERYGPIIADLKSHWNSFVGRQFEDVARDFLINKYVRFSQFGRWWNRSGDEIDLVGLDGANKEILFCECKWQENVHVRSVLEILMQKADLVRWNNDTRKEKYVIFAKSFKTKDRLKGVSLFDLKDLESFYK